MIRNGDKIIRPCQDCVREYGYSLIFRELDEVSLRETGTYYLKHEDVRVVDKWGRNIAIFGLHTYNEAAGIEVIDIKQKNKIHISELFWRLINKAGGLFRR